MEIQKTATHLTSPSIITAEYSGSLKGLSIEVMMRASLVQDISKKIDDLKAQLTRKMALMGAYHQQIGKLEIIEEKHHGGGDTKIYKTFSRMDYAYDEKTGEVIETKKGHLATKDPQFGAKYTPKAALTAEIERLKKKEDKLKKEVESIETDLKELLTRKKAVLEEVANGLGKKERTMQKVSERMAQSS